MLRLLAARPAALRFLRLAVPRVRSSFAPGGRERAASGPGLFNRVPLPALVRGDDQVSQVPGEPPCVHAPLSDPGELFTPGLLRRVDAAFRSSNDVGAREDCLSRLHHAACTLPVYASQGGSLRLHGRVGQWRGPGFE